MREHTNSILNDLLEQLVEKTNQLMRAYERKAPPVVLRRVKDELETVQNLVKEYKQYQIVSMNGMENS